MEKLTIERSKWLSPAPGNSKTAMYNSKKMCCLGHLAHKVYGVPKSILRNTSSPDLLSNKTKLLDDSVLLSSHTNSNSFFRKWNTSFSDSAIRINDDRGLTKKEREVKLKRLFAEQDIELTFVD